jgi:hypothetical protein
MLKKIILIALLTLSISSIQGANLCTRYENDGKFHALLENLAEKLFYDFTTFCQESRIGDIQKEVRRYYYQDSDQYEDHTVVTLHYVDYSCEYHFNLERREWITSRQYCYNTW